MDFRIFGIGAIIFFITIILFGFFAIAFIIFVTKKAEGLINLTELKECPFCNELIQEKAEICDFCGR